MIKKLAIFDFDGTLKDTPVEVPRDYLPRPGPDGTAEEMQMFRQRGVMWLNDPRSIDDPEGDYPWIEDVVQAARDAYDEETTLSVLLTARSVNIEDAIRGALDAKGVKFNRYIFSKSGLEKDPTTGRTAFFPPDVFKRTEVAKLIQQYPDVSTVAVWEDSEKNLDAIENVVPPEIEYVRNLETTRQSAISARKNAHARATISEESLMRSFIRGCLVR